MKVRALRTVYCRSEGKEYEKGQVFEATEREARVFMKLSKAEPLDAPAKKTVHQPRPTITAAAMKAEEPAETPEASPRRYRRRDLLPES